MESPPVTPMDFFISSGEAGDLGAKYGGNITDYELRFAQVRFLRRNVGHFGIRRQV